MMRSQKGFTLLELLITVAISGLIISSLGSSIYQIITVTQSGNDRMTAIHELQNAGHWVSLDGQMARTAIGGDALVLTLPDNSSTTYSVVDNELRRTAGESQITLAQNISGISFSVENSVITMSVTSSPPGRPNISEQGTYKILLRPTGGE